jgi:hypothetical protein
MSAPKTPSLKDRFDKLANTYVEQFCRKNNVQSGFWVADKTGETIHIAGQYFQYEDIRYDIDNDVPKGKIWEWMEYISEMSDYSIGFGEYLKMGK